jgi:hypothetical protein
MDVPDWQKKQKEFEKVKARAKALKLRLTCTICGAKAKLNCPCETTQYCTVECQRIDWRDRGHRKACKAIRSERAAEAARAEAPTPPPSPPREVFYGPAPRSHADEIRARIAAEHEAARARREADPEPEPLSARFGSCCPICREDWDVNVSAVLRVCCCRTVCRSCHAKIVTGACPLCRIPRAENAAESLARLRRHVENDVPEAMAHLAGQYSARTCYLGLPQNFKKAVKIYKRAVELGNVDAMMRLGLLYDKGHGVKADRKKSMQLTRMAADRGSASAQFNLAFDLEDDEATRREAFSYYKRSANQGLTDAVYSIGRCYERGIGVERDVDEARRWYERAAAKGDEDAIAKLSRNNLFR